MTEKLNERHPEPKDDEDGNRGDVEAAPVAGEWGDAGRNSIRGPSQFTFNASLQRSFRLKDRYNLDLRVDSTNLLNHVVFNSWNATLNPSLNNPLFGLPTAANAMRSLQTTLRLRL